MITKSQNMTDWRQLKRWIDYSDVFQKKSKITYPWITLINSAKRRAKASNWNLRGTAEQETLWPSARGETQGTQAHTRIRVPETRASERCRCLLRTDLEFAWSNWQKVRAQLWRSGAKQTPAASCDPEAPFVSRPRDVSLARLSSLALGALTGIINQSLQTFFIRFADHQIPKF